MLQLAETLKMAKEATELRLDQNQARINQHRRNDPCYSPGDKVWVTTHTLSSVAKVYSSKLAHRRDGLYRQHGPTSYELADLENPTVPLGVHHSSTISLYQRDANDGVTPAPVRAIRRGKPRKLVALMTTKKVASPANPPLRKK